MWAIPLICYFLTLQPASSSDAPPSFTETSNKIQPAVPISEPGDFCRYVYSVAKGITTSADSEVEKIMLAKVAKEEWNLSLRDDKLCERTERILESFRIFSKDRILSKCATVCTGMDTDKLGCLARVVESGYEDCASFSKSTTWQKACMAGLFDSKILSNLLPHLSEDFRSRSMALLFQTAFFTGDIDSVKAIVDFVKLSDKDVLERVPEVNIVFSESVDFFDALWNVYRT